MKNRFLLFLSSMVLALTLASCNQGNTNGGITGNTITDSGANPEFNENTNKPENENKGKVRIYPLEHGSITADKYSGNVGDLINLTIKPSKGYKISRLVNNNNPISFYDNKASFNLVKGANNISATFRELSEDESYGKIVLHNTDHGKLILSDKSAKVGSLVSVDVITMPGYKLKAIYFNGEFINKFLPDTSISVQVKAGINHIYGIFVPESENIEPKESTISTFNVKNGALIFNKVDGNVGDKVKVFAITENKNYYLNYILVNSNYIEPDDSGMYCFELEAGENNVTAEFKEINNQKATIEYYHSSDVTVKFSKHNGYAGDIVFFNIILDEGYALEYLKINGTNVRVFNNQGYFFFNVGENLCNVSVFNIKFLSVKFNGASIKNDINFPDSSDKLYAYKNEKFVLRLDIACSKKINNVTFLLINGVAYSGDKITNLGNNVFGVELFATSNFKEKYIINEMKCNIGSSNFEFYHTYNVEYEVNFISKGPLNIEFVVESEKYIDDKFILKGHLVGADYIRHDTIKYSFNHNCYTLELNIKDIEIAVQFYGDSSIISDPEFKLYYLDYTDGLEHTIYKRNVLNVNDLDAYYFIYDNYHICYAKSKNPHIRIDSAEIRGCDYKLNIAILDSEYKYFKTQYPIQGCEQLVINYSFDNDTAKKQIKVEAQDSIEFTQYEVLNVTNTSLIATSVGSNVFDKPFDKVGIYSKEFNSIKFYDSLRDDRIQIKNCNVFRNAHSFTLLGFRYGDSGNATFYAQEFFREDDYILRDLIDVSIVDNKPEGYKIGDTVKFRVELERELDEKVDGGYLEFYNQNCPLSKKNNGWEASYKIKNFYNYDKYYREIKFENFQIVINKENKIDFSPYTYYFDLKIHCDAFKFGAIKTAFFVNEENRPYFDSSSNPTEWLVRVEFESIDPIIVNSINGCPIISQYNNTAVFKYRFPEPGNYSYINIDSFSITQDGVEETGQPYFSFETGY